MTPWRPLARGLAICLMAASFLALGSSSAEARVTVWYAPVRDQATGAVDQALTEALRTVVRLRADPPFGFGNPPASCKDGCLLIHVQGSRGTSPAYTIQLRSFAGGRRWTVSLTAPRSTTVASLANAIYLKCQDLIGSAPAPPRPRRRPVVKGPPKRPRGGRAARRFTVGLGPSLMVGLDRRFLTFGVDAAFEVRLIGPMMLRALVGWQDLGRCTSGAPCSYNALPINLLAGARWDMGRLTLAGYAGVSLLVLFVDFSDPVDRAATDLATGVGVELRAAVRLHDRIRLGLSVRGVFMADDLDIQLGNNTDEARFRLAHALIATTIDVSFRF